MAGLKIGHQFGSSATVSEASQNTLCVYLSIALLIGLLYDLLAPDLAGSGGAHLDSERERLVETLDGAVFNFRRGKSFVSVNLENARIHQLELAVDYAYYGKLGR